MWGLSFLSPIIHFSTFFFPAFFWSPFLFNFSFLSNVRAGNMSFSLLSAPTFSQKLPVKTTDGARNNVVFEGS